MDPAARAELERNTHLFLIGATLLLVGGTAVVGCVTGSMSGAFRWLM